MKNILLLLLLSLPSLVLSQVVLGQVDTFEDYTLQNWTKNTSIPNSNIYDGGPSGAGDNFLRVEASGSGSNLNLMTKNTAQWKGDYYQGNLPSRIKYISMDVRNSGTNVIFLRLAFQTNYGLIYRGCTTNAVAVIPNEGWKKISISILEANMTGLTSPWDYAVMFGSGSLGVEEMRILHNSVPAWEATANASILDIDNIRADSQLLGVEEFQTENKLILYPNPANEFITINNYLSTENFAYKIVDIAGRVIEIGNSKFNDQINIQNLITGNYIIQIQTESGQKFNEKLLKK